MAILPALLKRISEILPKIPAELFCSNWKAYYKINIKGNESKFFNTVLKKIKVGGYDLISRFVIKLQVIKKGWYWPKNWQICQWDTIESLETNAHIYGQLIFLPSH